MTPGRIASKWETRVDTKNFYNRVLGRPYADPDTMPVSEDHLRAAQNPDLHWGPLPPRGSDGVFMGIDQMGQENYVVIKAKVGDRMRLLHLEIIQDADPWRRCSELMREFRVRHVAVESAPNFNEAQRFASAHEGRVFLASYQDHADEILQWGDRMRDRASTRPSDDAIRTPWTVSIDQPKMMAWSLSKWSRGEVETPDSRTLRPTIRTRQGVRPVAICQEIFWLHLQRVALVTETTVGREDERRLRRAVKKIGIDPHFAFANMLCDVAWVRAYGTSRMLFSDPPDLEENPVLVKQSPMRQQIAEFYPELDALMSYRPSLTCGDCTHFDRPRGRCILRRYTVKAEDTQCDFLVPRLDEDDDEYD
jgi:hypothetical protein